MQIFNNIQGLLNEEEDSGMDIAQLGITKRELCCMPTRDLNKFLKVNMHWSQLVTGLSRNRGLIKKNVVI